VLAGLRRHGRSGPNGALLDEKAFPEQVTEVALVADRSAPDRVRLEDLAVMGWAREPTSR
jgi:hypothetical protein